MKLQKEACMEIESLLTKTYKLYDIKSRKF